MATVSGNCFQLGVDEIYSLFQVPDDWFPMTGSGPSAPGLAQVGCDRDIDVEVFYLTGHQSIQGVDGPAGIPDASWILSLCKPDHVSEPRPR